MSDRDEIDAAEADRNVANVLRTLMAEQAALRETETILRKDIAMMATDFHAGMARLRMPDELVERVRCAVEDGFDDQDAHSILSDILAWHESLKEKPE